MIETERAKFYNECIMKLVVVVANIGYKNYCTMYDQGRFITNTFIVRARGLTMASYDGGLLEKRTPFHGTLLFRVGT